MGESVTWWRNDDMVTRCNKSDDWLINNKLHGEWHWGKPMLRYRTVRVTGNNPGKTLNIKGLRWYTNNGWNYTNDDMNGRW